VTLDLLTYADLELLRQQKSGVGARTASSTRVASSTTNTKKYLIVTYTVEFDRQALEICCWYQKFFWLSLPAIAKCFTGYACFESF
jgi:hypothetical protein